MGFCVAPKLETYLLGCSFKKHFLIKQLRVTSMQSCESPIYRIISFFCQQFDLLIAVGINKYENGIFLK